MLVRQGDWKLQDVLPSLVSAVIGLLVAIGGNISTGQEPASFFETEVAPILKRRCLDCHHDGEDSGGISFQNRASARLDDIVHPGRAVDSDLIELVEPDGFGNAAMPKQRTALTGPQIETLRKWIDQGAHWPEGFALQPGNNVTTDWWSLRSLEPVPVPKPADPGKWIRNEIDAFVLERLQEKELSHSPPADPVTLIRRLYFDLTGLPPTPETIESFAADPSDEHYGQIVDQLLTSPQYGERWARHWLDLVHYGDTHGFDKDKLRPTAWRYRDWVIRSLNSDMPYKEFVRLQIAGDVLHPNDRDAIIATGMIVAGPFDWVGQIEVADNTLEKKRIRNLDRDDMVATVMNAFTSTTAQCARCHDHKFDPVTQEDYYRLQAVFAGIDRAQRNIPLEPADREALEVLTESKTQLEKVFDSAEQDLVLELNSSEGPLNEKLTSLREQCALLPTPIEKTRSTTNGYHSQFATSAETIKTVSVQLAAPSEIEFVTIIPARPVDFPDTPGFAFPVRWILELFDANGNSKSIADWQDQDFPNPGDQFLVFGNEHPGPWTEIRLTANRLATRSPTDNQYALALGEIQAFHKSALVSTGATVTASDSINSGRWHENYLVDGQTSRNRLAVTGGVAKSLVDWAKHQASIRELVAEQDVLREPIRIAIRTRIADAKATLEIAEVKLREATNQGMTYCAATDFAAEGSFHPTGGKPRDVFVLDRGMESSPQVDLGAVAPGAIAALGHLQHHFELPADSEGVRRVALADWTTDHENPLTWRSIVNRVWQHHFGTGLVATSNDFGRMGSRPSHPELLDWMAIRFRDSGGSLKQLHHLMVTSATYRQSSAHDEGKSAIDAGNQYLWRMNRRRMDVEQIRDAMLVAAGQLDSKMYGPGYRPFELTDDHSPRFDYDQIDLDDPSLYRRSIYRFIVRSVPQPFFESLDCADPSQITDMRNESTTALQALALMNNRLALHLAGQFADGLQTNTPVVEIQVRLAARQVWSRDPNPEEQQLLVELADSSGLIAVCRTLFNSNEFVFVD